MPPSAARERGQFAPVNVPRGITAAQIRDGEPLALAALCQRKGGAVFGYCEHVAHPGYAIEAAADAFADFRVAIDAAGEPSDREAEALLRHSTRRAAARRGVNAMAASAAGSGGKGCGGQEIKLVRYVEGGLAPAVGKVFADHVARCRSCAMAMRRLEAGERALERPPRAPLPPRVAAEILEAMVIAAPMRACGRNAAVAYQEAMRILTDNGAVRDDQPPPPLPPAAAAPTEAARDRIAVMRPPDVSRRRMRRRRIPLPGFRPYWEPQSGWAERLRSAAAPGVVLSGMAGAAFAVGLVALTGDGTSSSSTPPVNTSQSATATILSSKRALAANASPNSAAPAPRSNGGRLRIEVLSTTVHPVRGGGARVSIHARLSNATDTPARRRRPVLYVDGESVGLAAGASDSAAALLAPLRPGSVADGRLHFDTKQPVARRLTTARVRLRISGRSIPLTPVVSTRPAST